MVQLEEVEDEEFDRVQLGEKDFNEDDGDFTDTGMLRSFNAALVLLCHYFFLFWPYWAASLSLFLLITSAPTILFILPHYLSNHTPFVTSLTCYLFYRQRNFRRRSSSLHKQ